MLGMCEDAVHDGCGLAGGKDVVDAEDVGAGEDGGGVGYGGGDLVGRVQHLRSETLRRAQGRSRGTRILGGLRR